MGVKSKYSNCDVCPLQAQKMVLRDSNCKKPEEVEVLIFAEAPSHKEVEENKPLVGRAGKIFRKAFRESGLETLNYYITNVVLCSNIENGKTFNPPPEAVSYCKPNWKKLLESVKPKVILLLGSTAMESFGFGNSEIMKKRGKILKYNDIPVIITAHPSYVLRNGGDKNKAYEDFLSDFKKGFEIVKSSEMLKDMKDLNETADIKNEKGICSFQLPSWCYSEDVCLFDIQHIRNTDEVIYIFKDKNGKKIYFNYDGHKRYYYSLNCDIKEAPMLCPIEKTDINIDKGKGRDYTKALYESDVRIQLKHSIDYRFNRGSIPEAAVDPKIMFFDIEVFSNGDLNFPNPKFAPKPINAISWSFNNGPVNVIIANLLNQKYDLKKFKKIEEKLNCNIFVVKGEHELLTAFCNIIKEDEPDILAGWNTNGFDLLTIYNRMKRLNMNVNDLSPLGQVFFSDQDDELNIYGVYPLDMLTLYKKFSTGEEESHTLDFICNKVLKKGKVKYEGSLDTLFERNIEDFIEYSVTDTKRLSELEDSLGHINLIREMIKICSSTWKNAEKSTGLVDPLCILYAKKQGLVCRNTIREECDEEEVEDDDNMKNPGAYVKPPKSGFHTYIIDLDFASLYPSIVRTINIGPNTFIAKIKDTPEDRIIFFNDEKEYFFSKTGFNWIYDIDKVPENDISIILDPLSNNCKEYKVTKEKLKKYMKQNDAIMTSCGTIFKGHSKSISFFGDLLQYLMDSRVIYKNQMKEAGMKKDKANEKIYDCMQLAFKILANSVYGVLYCPSFRFFNIDMARTITMTGQELVKFSGYHLGKYMQDKNVNIDYSFSENYDNKNIPYLIYQDTDSLFIEMGEYLNG